MSHVGGPAGPEAEAEAGSMDQTEQLRETIRETLRNVIDPELGLNIVDLGLVYEIDVQGSSVRIAYTLTAMGCPLGPVIEGDIHHFLSEVPGWAGWNRSWCSGLRGLRR